MVSKTPVIPRQELRDADGQAFAYIVSAEEMHRLLAEADDLRQQLLTSQKLQNGYAAELSDILHTFAPPPPTEVEMEEALASPFRVNDLIAKLDAGS